MRPEAEVLCAAAPRELPCVCVAGPYRHRPRAGRAGHRVLGTRQQRAAPRGGGGGAVGRRALLLHRGLHHGALGLRRAALLLHGRVRRLPGTCSLRSLAG